MTNRQTQDRLDRIEAMFGRMAASQERMQERLEQSAQRHDAEVAEIRDLQRENATGIAELREAQQANLMAIAETRQQLQASIGDVVDMISQQSAALAEERDQTIGVEVDTLNALSDIQEGQARLRADVQNLNTYVRG